MSWQPPSTPPSGGYGPAPGGYGPPPGGYAPPPGYPPPPGGYPAPPGYPQYPAGPYGRPGPGAGLEYATFWRRFGGYLIDILVIAVPTVVAFFVIFGSTLGPYFNQMAADQQAGLTAPQLALPSSGLVPYVVFDAVLAALYFGLLVAGWGSTVGQRAVGLRVVCQEDATKNLPMGRALFRAVVWWGPALLFWSVALRDLSGLVVLLALLWVTWDPRNQGLHDKLGRALVVRASLAVPAGAYGALYPYPAPGYPPAPTQYSPTPTQYPPVPTQSPPPTTQYPPTPPQYPSASQ